MGKYRTENPLHQLGESTFSLEGCLIPDAIECVSSTYMTNQVTFQHFLVIVVSQKYWQVLSYNLAKFQNWPNPHG